jgi:hypothetical protein
VISSPFYQNRYQNFWANGFWTPGATKKLPGLKILVSVVRCRPGPPNSNNALLMRGIFFCGLAGLEAISLGYPHHEASF